MEEITVKELLERVAAKLEAIQIPVVMANNIARPIWEAIQDIRRCAEACAEAPQDGPDKAPEEVTEDVQS